MQYFQQYDHMKASMVQRQLGRNRIPDSNVLYTYDHVDIAPVPANMPPCIYFPYDFCLLGDRTEIRRQRKL